MPPSRPRDGREFVRVAVTLPNDAKLLDTSDVPRCGWLFVCGLLHARRQRTNGVLRPEIVAREADVHRRLTAQLVKVGMWHEPGHDCPRCDQPPAKHVIVHDYLDHQQSREESDAAREAARKAAEARWSKRPPKDAGRNADRNAGSNAERNAEAEAEAEKKEPLLTYVGRLAGSDARVADGLPAEVIDAWQDVAGPDVDLVAEAKAYLQRYGTSPASNPGAAWAGWLRQARTHAERRAAAEALAAGCGTCAGGWLDPDPDDPLERPRACPTCRPRPDRHLHTVPDTDHERTAS